MTINRTKTVDMSNISPELSKGLDNISLAPYTEGQYFNQNFIVNGDAGNDTILIVDGGKDSIYGGSGSDFITDNGIGYNLITAGNGNHSISLGNPIEPGLRNDLPFGGDNDTVMLGNGNDEIDIYADNYTIAHQTLATGQGSVVVGMGNDGFLLGGNNDIASLGNSNYSIGLGASFSFSHAGMYFHGGGDTLTLGNGADSISDNGTGHNLIAVGNGNDRISDDGVGYNTITVGEGNDSISDNSYYGNYFMINNSDYTDGHDSITAGSGNDAVSITGNNGTFFLGNGDDSVSIIGQTLLVPPGDISYSGGHEAITLGNGADSISDNGIGHNLIAAGNGNDSVSIVGSFFDDLNGTTYVGGRDTITLGNGADSISDDKSWAGYNSFTAGNGNDTVSLGTNNDTVTLGSGRDTILLNNTSWGHDVIKAGSGYNTLDLRNISQNLTINLRTAQSPQISDGTNTLLWENHTLQQIIGGSGNNRVTLDSSHSDTFWCKNGNDTVNGGNTGDLFVGGSGNNLLKGGTGHDSYLFYNGFGHDTIQDAGGWDQVKLMPGIKTNKVAIASDNQGNLLIGVVGAPNSEITVKNRASTGWLERLQTGNGSFLSGSNINVLLQEISAYAASHGETINNLQAVENNSNLMAMVNAAWHH